MEKLVHLVYIHGFQGNDTSFQSFPLHLQEKLSSRIPPDSGIRFQSSLYPTYKSAKPISYATKNFLRWLATQPDGPVIVVGHSMGGLLAAEAATDPSNRGGPHSKPKRIVAVLAFDTPYLGMHPHVVVSGIASLLPKEGREEEKGIERELNQHPQIQIVDAEATDEWEKFKKRIDRKVEPHSQIIQSSSTLISPPSPTRSSSTFSFPESGGSSKPRSPLRFFNKAVDFFASHSKKDDDPVVRWLQKHADDPFNAGKRWVTERCQFGSCMFDPSGLKDRYTSLVEWNGLWVNYWSHTADSHQSSDADAKRVTARQRQAETLANDIALLDSGMVDTGLNGQPESSSAGGSAAQLKPGLLHQDQSTLDKFKEKPSLRHFIVLPTGLGRVLGGGENWEKVEIAGVNDEVAAHTGLFIPQHNLNYANFVDTVADKIFDWCKEL